MKLAPWEPDIRQLVDRIRSGEIDLQPAYQRQEIWPLMKKKRLIDTILRGWSIPPVHLVETHESTFEVLDGQQRLAAVRDFMDDKFAIDGRITPRDEEIFSLHGYFYSSLDPRTKRFVDNYVLRCFKLTDYAPEEPGELFYRLNQPTSLTAGEQRNALYGPARIQLKKLVDVFIDAGNKPETIGFSNARLAYDDVLARILVFTEEKSFAQKGTESRISERFREDKAFSKSVMDKTTNSIRLFSQARKQIEPHRFNKASILSWLLFYIRFVDRDPNPSAIKKFYDPEYADQDAADVLVQQAFTDRASLRVTDVSSVVYRDVCLWHSYFHHVSKSLPAYISKDTLSDLEQRLNKRGADFDDVASKVIDIDAWGTSL